MSAHLLDLANSIWNCAQCIRFTDFLKPGPSNFFIPNSTALKPNSTSAAPGLSNVNQPLNPEVLAIGVFPPAPTGPKSIKTFDMRRPRCYSASCYSVLKITNRSLPQNIQTANLTSLNSWIKLTKFVANFFALHDRLTRTETKGGKPPRPLTKQFDSGRWPQASCTLTLQVPP